MKEATGEMNMTVITIIAIGAILGLFWFLWPQVKNSITNTWNGIQKTECSQGQYYDESSKTCVNYK